MALVGKEKKVASRYRSLITSIALFIALITVLLVVSIFSSLRMQRDNAVVFQAGNMRTSVQSIMKELYNLKLYYGEDPNSPVVKRSLRTLAENQKLFNQTLQVFNQGGSLQDGAGENIRIDALLDSDSDVEMEQALQALQKNWEPLNSVLSDYLKDASSIYSDSQTLDLAVLSAQDNNRRIFDNVSTIANKTERRFVYHTTLMRWMQVIGIVVAIIYFAVFVFFFMRKLQSSDKRAMQANEEINEIMTTVNSGLFLLDQDLNIGSQYSAELTKILERKEIAGVNLIVLLQDIVERENLKMTQSFVQQLYNTRVKEQLIADLNPLSRIEVAIKREDGKVVSKFLDFRFRRVYEAKEIVRILVSVVDSTSTVRLEEHLQQERAQGDVRFQMLDSLIAAEPTIMNEFIEKVRNYADKINKTLKDPANNQAALRYKVDSIFREIHTIKGEASALKLSSFVGLAEKFEDHLQQLKSRDKLVGEDFLPLAVLLENLLTLSVTINSLNDKVGSHVVTVNQVLPAEVFKASSEKFIADLAERNQKQVGISFGDAEQLNHISNEKIGIIRELVQQLLRNAVVHGIEAPTQRSAAHKMAVGHVRVQFWNQGHELFCAVEDDGQGINYDAIRNQALSRKLCTEAEVAAMDNIQLNKLLFSSGFSTLTRSHEDAGRGVGLDAVKNKIFELGGRIKLDSSQGYYTRFLFKLPM